MHNVRLNTRKIYRGSFIGGKYQTKSREQKKNYLIGKNHEGLEIYIFIIEL